MSRPYDLFGERAKAAAEFAEARRRLRTIEAKLAITLSGASEAAEPANPFSIVWSKYNPAPPDPCTYRLSFHALPQLTLREPAAPWPVVDFGLRRSESSDAAGDDPEKEQKSAAERWDDFRTLTRRCSQRGQLTPNLLAELNGWTLYEGPNGEIEAAQTESEAWAAIALEVLKDGRPQLLSDLADKCARVTVSSDDEETLRARARKTLHVWLNRRKDILRIGRGMYLLKPQIRRNKSQSEEEAGAHSSAPEPS